MEFTREEFREYLERNKETVFGVCAGNCPLSGFLSEKFNRLVLVGFFTYGGGWLLPDFAKKFVYLVTFDYDQITGYNALDLLDMI